MTFGVPKTNTRRRGVAGRRHAGVLRTMLHPRIVAGALKVSAVVGTALNLINLGEQVWTPHTINFWRVAMNFIVPFCVSAYSAARNQVSRARED